MTGSPVLMAITYISFCYILVFSFLASNSFVYGAVVVRNPPGAAAPSFPNSGGCSPLSKRKAPVSRSQILLQDERRVRVIYSGSGGKGVGILNNRVGVRQPLPKSLSSFIVTVGFGTPAKYFNLILDTGSYITWVSCKEQNRVFYKEQSLYYNPSNSSTSSHASCFPRSCSYEQTYLDNSTASGNFTRDTIIIKPYLIPNFTFVCAVQHSEDFGEAHGILALGQGSTSSDNVDFGYYSLMSQTETKFEKVFCHCLPRIENSEGYLCFGEDAFDKCRNSVSNYTSLLSNPRDPSLYYVNLIAITIGQKKLEISTSATSASSSSSPSTILDSGTVISRLPSKVYSELSSEFRRLMENYSLPVAFDVEKILDTCYNLQGLDNFEIPEMVLHFENLDVNLDQTAVIWKGEDDSRVCLAFAPAGDELTIIGYHQLQKLNILYNVPERKVGIGPGDC